MLLGGQRVLPARLLDCRLRVRRADDRRRPRTRARGVEPLDAQSARMRTCPNSRRSAGTTPGLPRSSRIAEQELTPGSRRGAASRRVRRPDRGGRAAEHDHEPPSARVGSDRAAGRRRLGRARSRRLDRRGAATPSDDLAPRRARAGIRRLARAGHRRERRRRAHRARRSARTSTAGCSSATSRSRSRAARDRSSCSPRPTSSRIRRRSRPSSPAIERRIPILTLAARTGLGLDGVRSILDAGTTGVLLGPSGVGKSTLVNALVG